MYRLFNIARLMVCLILLTLSPPSIASVLSGEKQILLVDNKGQETAIGTLVFQAQGTLSQYSLQIDHNQFQDYFLSMKEMKCLEGPELWCHIPYPYPQPHTVSYDDLSWLSHDLLFMFKKQAEFGANFWNGIYYHLRIEGEQIKGEAQAVDLNLLASPPDDPNVPPITEAERDEINLTTRWLPTLIIR